VEARAGSEQIDIVLDRTENKRVAINRLPISRMGELMGVAATVFFSPGEIKVVQASPGERRTFMDVALCQISRAYFYLLQRYNRTLSQRNRLLKSGHAGDDALDVWDMQLAEHGSRIIKTRRGFIERLAPFAAKNHAYLSDEREQLVLTYEGIDGATVEEIADNFKRLLKTQREKDRLMGHTHSGPQKDDIAIIVDGMDARSYGSQGQLRTAALSLKLAELDLNLSEKGDCPILLLDDVLSELDKSRQERLLRRAAEIQTILTCTYIDNAVFGGVGEYKAFKVEAGQVFDG
jgi:DNA replication and repair protein RecF